MDARLRRIAAKLAIVPHLPGRSHSFGEEKHRFRLGPPLPEAEVAAFEARYGVRLPWEYRDFLTTLGHGGAGPYYGLLPLESWHQSVIGDLPPGHLTRPFPLEPGPRPGPEWCEGLGSNPFSGAIPLVSQGCTYAGLLVVTGPARGRVVNIDLDRQPPFFTSDTGFLAWYERWLDEIADGLASGGFSSSLPGDQATLASVLSDSTDPLSRQSAALTLGRHPALSPQAMDALAEAARRDGHAMVRLHALSALTSLLRGPALSVLEQALDDPASEVRARAVRGLERRGERWHPRLRQALHDEHGEVREAAIGVLDRCEVLTEADVLPLADDPAAAVRAAVIVALRRLGSDHAEPMARAALDDPDLGVRHCGLGVLVRSRWLTGGDLAKAVADPGLRERAERLAGR
ncbi:HEAT repeat domain-containing protein [Actinomadura viridis]|uniref:HEAT repeat domain-containing protein n=1 Tax=Actinomadura viridis TaxID=58110 RepID=UPI00368B485A